MAEVHLEGHCTHSTRVPTAENAPGCEGAGGGGGDIANRWMKIGARVRVVRMRICIRIRLT